MTSDLKKTATFGAAFGVTVVLAATVLYWLASSQKRWDTSSIKGTSLTVSQTLTLTDVPPGEPEHFEGSGFALNLVFENKTRNDYTVPADFKLFSRDDRTAALSEIKMTIDHPYVIPAKERAEVEVQIEYSCITEDMDTGKRIERTAADCFNEKFGHAAGLVGFDYATHTRVDIPKPTFDGGIPEGEAKLGSATGNDLRFRPAKPVEHGPWEKYQKDGAAKLIPPDKEREWFKKVDACDVADQLVISCKAQHFLPLNIPGDPFADFAFSDPLPALPTPPKGYTLDPNKADCRTANEWRVYCENKKPSKQ